MFTRQAVLPISVPGSAPLYLPNNLSSSSNSRLCYVKRATDVAVVHKGDVTHTLKINFSVVLQAKYVPASRDSSILVVATSVGVQFFSENGEYLIFFYPTSQLLDALGGEAAAVSDECCECTCIESSQSSVCVGTSLGFVLVFNLISDEELSYNKYVGVSTNNSIASIACDEHTVFCGTESGDILSAIATSDSSSQACIATGQGFSVLQLIATKTLLIGGYADGHVRIYNVSQREVVYEISAHSKMISGMIASVDEGYFVTCSDDHYVRVWGLPALEGPGKTAVKLLQVERVDNRLLTGLAFLHGGDFCATSYDDDDIAVFRRL